MARGPAHVTVIIAAVCAATAASGDVLSESRLKAELLVRFSNFTEWPPNVFADAKSPFILCILGTEVQSAAFDALGSRRIKDRPVSLRRISGTPNFEGCHELFISDITDYTLADVIAQTERMPILVVSQTPGFANRGTMINLYDDDGFVRFEVNLAATKKAGLTLSPKMLRLARLVRP